MVFVRSKGEGESYRLLRGPTAAVLYGTAPERNRPRPGCSWERPAHAYVGPRLRVKACPQPSRTGCVRTTVCLLFSYIARRCRLGSNSSTTISHLQLLFLPSTTNNHYFYPPGISRRPSPYYDNNERQQKMTTEINEARTSSASIRFPLSRNLLLNPTTLCLLQTFPLVIPISVVMNWTRSVCHTKRYHEKIIPRTCPMQPRSFCIVSMKHLTPHPPWPLNHTTMVSHICDNSEINSPSSTNFSGAC